MTKSTRTTLRRFLLSPLSGYLLCLASMALLVIFWRPRHELVIDFLIGFSALFLIAVALAYLAYFFIRFLQRRLGRRSDTRSAVTEYSTILPLGLLLTTTGITIVDKQGGTVHEDFFFWIPALLGLSQLHCLTELPAMFTPTHA